jgi:sugar phosphate isomerase/epimerase
MTALDARDRSSSATTPVVSICEWIFGRRPFEEVVRVVREAGYDAIELAGEPGRPDRARLLELLDGLPVSGLSAMGLWPTDARDLAHREREARRRAVDYYRALIDLAVELRAPTVGVVPTASGRQDTLTSYGREWGFAVDGIREIGQLAGEHGIALAIEPLNRYETPLVNRVEQALALAEEVGMPHVGVVADAFHMQLEEADLVDPIARAGGRLRAVHLADSNRRGLGHGRLDVGPLVARAVEGGFSGPFVMEFLAPGPNPFEANKDAHAMALLDVYAAESAARVKAMVGATLGGRARAARRGAPSGP